VFSPEKTKKSGQSDHLNWVFCAEVSACRKLPRVIGSEAELMDEPSVPPHRVTQLLQQWGHGDDAALAELTLLVYDELRRIAHHYMEGQRRDHTLQTTALVNEAYLRLAEQSNPNWQSRAHFLAVAARAMRQILVSYARSNRAQKRGGGGARIELDESAILSPEQSKEIVDLHEALERLETLDSRKAQVVELKFFGGLNYDEIAEVLKIARVTVRRDWEFAKLWLYTELHSAP
jgi:RNA polymerase sigma-70 factor, ECF subfamily